MGNDDARRDSRLLTKLALALLLGGCLNPRPEELPSSFEPTPAAADAPATAAAPADPGTEGANEPASPSGDRQAPSAPPAPAAPPALDISAPEPPDAGADAGTSSDAASAADAG